MPAILSYLCNRNEGSDFYPSDVETRAYIDQYRHFHHNRTRNVMAELMAPHVTVAFLDHLKAMGTDGAQALFERATNPEKRELGQAAVSQIFRLIELGYLRGTDYLCTNSPSIADIACYEEVGQLRWAGLFDFSPFPKLARWIDAMAELPQHDLAHQYNIALGDIVVQRNTLERFVAANAAAVDALEEAGVAITTLDGTGDRELVTLLGG